MMKHILYFSFFLLGISNLVISQDTIIQSGKYGNRDDVQFIKLNRAVKYEFPYEERKMFLEKVADQFVKSESGIVRDTIALDLLNKTQIIKGIIHADKNEEIYSGVSLSGRNFNKNILQKLGQRKAGFGDNLPEDSRKLNGDSNTTLELRKKSFESLPNLIYTDLSINVSGSVVSYSGKAVNNGTGNAGSCTLLYYLYDDINEEIYVLGTDEISPLASSASLGFNFSKDVNTVDGIPEGTYYIGIYIDVYKAVAESNENDNGGYYYSRQVTVSEVEDMANLRYNQENTLLTLNGTRLSLSMEVENNGNLDAAGFTICYLFSDEEYNFYDISEEDVSGLEAGGSVIKTLDIDLATHTEIPEGRYFFIAYIDSKKVIHETDEEDNIFIYDTYIEHKPELQKLPNLTYNEEYSYAELEGRFLKHDITITNTGDADAGECRGLLSFVEKNLDNIQPIGSFPIRSLGGGNSLTYHWDLDLTEFTDIEDGEYYLTTFIDYEEDIKETDEDDNLFICENLYTLPLLIPDLDVKPRALILNEEREHIPDVLEFTADTVLRVSKTKRESYSTHEFYYSEEFKSELRKKTYKREYLDAEIKESIDWRDYDSPVKNQGSCGACWAFSALAQIENKTEFVDLSEQTLIACGYGNCTTGGSVNKAYEYISYYGIPLEDCYPYIEENGVCNEKCPNPDTMVWLESYETLWGLTDENTVDNLKSELQDGPVAASLNIPDNNDFFNYESGIYNPVIYDTTMFCGGHSIMIVGYNDAQRYFLIKNSWGTDWGIDGYGKISYDAVTNGIGFGRYATKATPKKSSGNILTLTNTGNEPLIISSLEYSHDCFLSNDISLPLTINPGGSTIMAVNINWTMVETTLNGTLTIVSNDTDEPEIIIPITLHPLELESYTIEAVAKPDNGGVIQGPGEYEEGELVTLKALANQNYLFVNWIEAETEVFSGESYSFRVDSDRSLVANFEIKSVDITVSVIPEEAGTVTGGGSYKIGQNVSMSANSNQGYYFINWTENGTEVSTDATYSFVAETDRSLTANFELEKVEITVVSNPAEGGTVTGSGIFEKGHSINLQALPNEGYKFVNWTENGAEVCKECLYTLSADKDCELIANFSSTVSVFDISEGTISIFPNPTTGKMYINLNSSVSGRISVKVLNITGKEMLERVYQNTSQIEIDMSGSPKGFYFITIKGEDIFEIKKVLKE